MLEIGGRPQEDIFLSSPHHFSLKEFLSIKTDFIVIDTGYWNGQALFVLAHKNLLNLK